MVSLDPYALRGISANVAQQYAILKTLLHAAEPLHPSETERMLAQYTELQHRSLRQLSQAIDGMPVDRVASGAIARRGEVAAYASELEASSSDAAELLSLRLAYDRVAARLQEVEGRWKEREREYEEVVRVLRDEATRDEEELRALRRGGEGREEGERGEGCGRGDSVEWGGGGGGVRDVLRGAERRRGEALTAVRSLREEMEAIVARGGLYGSEGGDGWRDSSWVGRASEWVEALRRLEHEKDIEREAALEAVGARAKFEQQAAVEAAVEERTREVCEDAERRVNAALTREAAAAHAMREEYAAALIQREERSRVEREASRERTRRRNAAAHPPFSLQRLTPHAISAPPPHIISPPPPPPAKLTAAAAATPSAPLGVSCAAAVAEARTQLAAQEAAMEARLDDLHSAWERQEAAQAAEAVATACVLHRALAELEESGPPPERKAANSAEPRRVVRVAEAEGGKRAACELHALRREVVQLEHQQGWEWMWGVEVEGFGVGWCEVLDEAGEVVEVDGGEVVEGGGFITVKWSMVSQAAAAAHACASLRAALQQSHEELRAKERLVAGNVAESKRGAKAAEKAESERALESAQAELAVAETRHKAHEEKASRQLSRAQAQAVQAQALLKDQEALAKQNHEQSSQLEQLREELRSLRSSSLQRESKLVGSLAEAEAEKERGRHAVRAAQLAMRQAQWEASSRDAAAAEAAASSERGTIEVAALQCEVGLCERQAREAALQAEARRVRLETIEAQREQETAWWKAELQTRQAQLEAVWRERYASVDAQLQHKIAATAALSRQVRSLEGELSITGRLEQITPTSLAERRKSLMASLTNESASSSIAAGRSQMTTPLNDLGSSIVSRRGEAHGLVIRTCSLNEEADAAADT
ncbi:hypothetical protein AB1Y20_019623 [Prymnesium parvum]|uniref:Uncharacterized protein n=1 Tax=Prymnesium parvum TaxID=97485 RepID=A0AB34JVL3_PRYPA